jgi:hypothetical protein
MLGLSVLVTHARCNGTSGTHGSQFEAGWAAVRAGKLNSFRKQRTRKLVSRSLSVHPPPVQLRSLVRF